MLIVVAWCNRRSRIAEASVSSPTSSPQSLKRLLLVRMIEPRSLERLRGPAYTSAQPRVGRAREPRLCNVEVVDCSQGVGYTSMQRLGDVECDLRCTADHRGNVFGSCPAQERGRHTRSRHLMERVAAGHKRNLTGESTASQGRYGAFSPNRRVPDLHGTA